MKINKMETISKILNKISQVPEKFLKLSLPVKIGISIAAAALIVGTTTLIVVLNHKPISVQPSLANPISSMPVTSSSSSESTTSVVSKVEEESSQPISSMQTSALSSASSVKPASKPEVPSEVSILQSFAASLSKSITPKIMHEELVSELSGSYKLTGSVIIDTDNNKHPELIAEYVGESTMNASLNYYMVYTVVNNKASLYKYQDKIADAIEIQRESRGYFGFFVDKDTNKLYLGTGNCRDVMEGFLDIERDAWNLSDVGIKKLSLVVASGMLKENKQEPNEMELKSFSDEQLAEYYNFTQNGQKITSTQYSKLCKRFPLVNLAEYTKGKTVVAMR